MTEIAKINREEKITLKLLDGHETRPPGKPLLMTEKWAYEKTLYHEKKPNLQDQKPKPSLTNISDDLKMQNSSLDDHATRVGIKNKSRRKVADELLQDTLREIE